MSVYINSTAKLWAPAGLSILAQRRKNYFLRNSDGRKFKTEITDGKLNILQEGRVKKFVSELPEITFSGKLRLSAG